MAKYEGHNRAVPLPGEPGDNLEFDMHEVTALPGGGSLSSISKMFESSPENDDILGVYVGIDGRPLTDDELIYRDALIIAADFSEASRGKDLSLAMYTNMLERGWAQYPTEDVLRIFQEDWNLLQSDAREIYEKRKVENRLRDKDNLYWRRHFKAVLKAAGVKVKRVNSKKSSDKTPESSTAGAVEAIHPKIYRANELINNIPECLDYDKLPAYYFDLSTHQILEGEQLLEQHIADGADFQNIHKLGELLRNFDIPLDQEKYAKIDSKEWDHERCKKYGRFINAIIVPPKNSRKKRLNDNIFNHAYHLGLGPSSWWLAREFTSLGNFYKEIEVADTYRRGLFNNLSVDFLIKYTRKIGEEKKRRPKGPDFEEMAAKSPNNPSADIVYERVKDMGGISKLIELSGYFVTETLDERGFLDWGVKFMRANDGEVPNVTQLLYLASIERGPSQGAIIRRFDKISNYQNQLASAYQEDSENSNQIKEGKLSQIAKDLNSGELPFALFNSGQSEKEMIALYAKYKLAKTLLSELPDDLRIFIRGSMDAEKFVRYIQTHNPSVSRIEIEQAATELGVFGDIWIMDGYMEDLKMGEGYRQFLDKFNTQLRERRRAAREKVKRAKAVA